jgi:hypothetical protein
MATRALPEHLIEAGAKLLSALDDAGLRPQGAAWLFDHALGDWRYVVATSLVETMGRSNVYRELLTVIKKLDIPQDLTVQDVHLVAPSGPLFKTISGALHIVNGRVTVKDSAINGTTVDAVIYRWTGAPTQTKAAKVQKEFKRRVKELAD